MKTLSCAVVCGLLHLGLNVLLLILGTCFLGLGLAEESTLLTTILSSESKIGTASVIIGVVLIVACILNCCFALDGSSIYYYVYAGILLLVFIAMAGLFAVYGVDLTKTVEREVTTSMAGMLHYADHDGHTDMDSIQEKLRCCGVSSYKDWLNVTENPSVPPSCCIKAGCNPSNPDYVFQEGCVSSLMGSAGPLFLKLSIIGFIILVLLPFQIVLVLMLVRDGETNAVLAPYSVL